MEENGTLCPISPLGGPLMEVTSLSGGHIGAWIPVTCEFASLLGGPSGTSPPILYFEAKTFSWQRGANSTFRLCSTREAKLFVSEKLFASMLEGQTKERLCKDSLSSCPRTIEIEAEWPGFNWYWTIKSTNWWKILFEWAKLCAVKEARLLWFWIELSALS